MLNLLVLQGRLTKDVVNKNGTAVFSIAVDVYNGDPMYVDVVAFKQTAEYCFNYLRKGNMVIVDGSLQIKKYQDRYYVSCVARTITGVGNNKENSLVKEENVVKEEETPVATDEDIDILPDDLPF